MHSIQVERGICVTALIGIALAGNARIWWIKQPDHHLCATAAGFELRLLSIREETTRKGARWWCHSELRGEAHDEYKAEVITL